MMSVATNMNAKYNALAFRERVLLLLLSCCIVFFIWYLFWGYPSSNNIDVANKKREKLLTLSESIVSKYDFSEEQQANTEETNTSFEEERAVVESAIQQNSADQNTDAPIVVIDDTRSEQSKASDKPGNEGVSENTSYNPTEEENTLSDHSESTAQQSEPRVLTSEEVKSDVQNGSNVSSKLVIILLLAHCLPSSTSLAPNNICVEKSLVNPP